MSEITETTPQELAKKDRAVVIAPAGCGKTELIARAVGCNEDGRQLILTHTHAGVKSLLDRLRKIGVPSKRFIIDTIAGFALKYAISFPGTSGIVEFPTSNQDWNEAYKGAAKIISFLWGEKILLSSYTGLYVDEYQDCTTSQHELILGIANSLPCRILGDPLQGIFDFGGDIVDWNKKNFPNFNRLPNLKTPWRWKNKNEALGNWLFKIRKHLNHGQQIDLRIDLPPGVRWCPQNPDNQWKACAKFFDEKNDSIVAMHKMPNKAHFFAKNLKGMFSSMEEMECKDLLKWSDKIENSTEIKRLSNIRQFQPY
ncbi:MAG: AAA family ATPase, partial [Candidatus Aminicenantes bacterium]|nr:AAA family ATPase [Candidatus Aminicenantes bacterium]